MLRERGVADELVQNRLLTNEATDQPCVLPRHTNQPGNRREDQTEQPLQRPVFLTEPAADAANHRRQHRNHSDERNQQTCHNHSDTTAGQRTRPERVNDVLRLSVADILHRRIQIGFLRLRPESLRNQQRARRVHYRCRQQVLQWRTEQGVTNQRRSGHRSKTARHTCEQLRLGQFRNIRLNDERSLRLPEENHRGSEDGLHLRGSHNELQCGTDIFNEVLHYPQVVEGTEDCAQEDDHWQHVEHEDEVFTRAVEKITEDKRGALICKVDHLLNGTGHALQRLEAGFPLQHYQREHRLQQQANAECAPVNGFPVL